MAILSSSSSTTSESMEDAQSPMEGLHASIGIKIVVAVIHLVLSAYGTLVYIQTPREGRKGRILRILLSGALVVGYMAGTIFEALNLFSGGSRSWMMIASHVCDFTMGSLYALYQGYRYHLCFSMRKSHPVVVAALSLMMLAQSALGIISLISVDRRWANIWFLAFAILISGISGLLAWLILETRSSLWKALGSSERASRTLEYLRIPVESAMPVVLLGIVFSSVSFFIDWSSPTNAMRVLLVNTLYFAILSLWSQIHIFRRTITLNRLYRRPTYHESLSSIFQPKSSASVLDFGGQLEMVESNVNGHRERMSSDVG
ncbi:hypothetical protein BKA70DRAFT_1342018 [Coprinopsis sp. MPI-PUGE-AT-0042]|nr:hypothetical protein BKA70DRAFT_1342018 [Coprinopsis sp. MPI-PUGE-AT-0042]